MDNEMIDCRSCQNTRRVWLEDESLAKGGLFASCPRCCCTDCGGALDGSWGVCPRCSAPELSLAQEAGEAR